MPIITLFQSQQKRRQVIFINGDDWTGNQVIVQKPITSTSERYCNSMF